MGRLKNKSHYRRSKWIYEVQQTKGDRLIVFGSACFSAI